MKFYKFARSFFSKVNNITESWEKGLDKIVSRGEKNFSVHRKYMNFLRPRKTALDEPLYKLSAGRSMVEMLGVLAIIGVLSVGAIAGYSKAMFKYKLNKQAEAVNSLINYALQYKDSFTYKENALTYFNEIFHKMGLIPNDIRYVSNTEMYDIFNNKLYIYYNNESGNNFGGIYYRFAASSEGAEICRNAVNVAKENHQNLWQVETYKYYNDPDKFTIEGIMYGDAYCTSGKKCLRNLTINDIDDLCNVCDEQTCTLYILWK